MVPKAKVFPLKLFTFCLLFYAEEPRGLEALLSHDLTSFFNVVVKVCKMRTSVLA